MTDNDRGSLLPLVAGLFALCGVFAVGVIDSTDLALTRTRLQTHADAAALVGAESFDPREAVFQNGAVIITLDDGAVHAAVAEFVDALGEPLTLTEAFTPDGRTAQVEMAAEWRPPMVSQFIPVRIQLTAAASARSVFGR